jgi:hypothetical protein
MSNLQPGPLDYMVAVLLHQQLSLQLDCNKYIRFLWYNHGTTSCDEIYPLSCLYVCIESHQLYAGFPRGGFQHTLPGASFDYSES